MRILAVDYGDKRTGVALSDATGLIATGLDTIQIEGMKKTAKGIVELIDRHNVTTLVLGFPKNMNGTVGTRGEKTIKLKEMLNNMTDIPIVLWDERLTSLSANTIMNEVNVRGKKRKDNIDKLASVLILENYLHSMRRDENV